MFARIEHFEIEPCSKLGGSQQHLLALQVLECLVIVADDHCDLFTGVQFAAVTAGVDLFLESTLTNGT